MNIPETANIGSRGWQERCCVAGALRWETVPWTPVCFVILNCVNLCPLNYRYAFLERRVHKVSTQEILHTIKVPGPYNWTGPLTSPTQRGRISRSLGNFFFFFFFLVLPVYCYQPISLHPHAHMLSHVIPWTSARQTPLSMDFSRQECWSGLPFPSPSWELLIGTLEVPCPSLDQSQAGTQLVVCSRGIGTAIGSSRGVPQNWKGLILRCILIQYFPGGPVVRSTLPQ